MQQTNFRHYFKIGFWFVSLSTLLLIAYCYHHWKNIKLVNLPVTNCDLRAGPCVTTLPNGEMLSLKITPTNMPVLTSVMLEVKTQELPIKKMNIHFKGKEMDMGEFKYALQLKKSGLYTAQTILPTCVHDEMIWHAVLKVDTKSEHYTVPFILVNQKPRPMHS
ncbi:hypothetical protein CC99x_000810 [Candidatus Berkiella cookevillensis]|uniref:FixH n=1 Tax=Candidatus Berkiella cookevillensis TaxID=437022 RepID=A0A0Q9YL00_9GAMM|nr:hypothetical protein [Candidatus Berkiella cookevillensis]MCS5707435.1 hypothetical protein [Candidatus Berkiella cookevillensis]